MPVMGKMKQSNLCLTVPLPISCPHCVRVDGSIRMCASNAILKMAYNSKGESIKYPGQEHRHFNISTRVVTATFASGKAIPLEICLRCWPHKLWSSYRWTQDQLIPCF